MKSPIHFTHKYLCDFFFFVGSLLLIQNLKPRRLRKCYHVKWFHVVLNVVLNATLLGFVFQIGHDNAVSDTSWIVYCRRNSFRTWKDNTRHLLQMGWETTKKNLLLDFIKEASNLENPLVEPIEKKFNLIKISTHIFNSLSANFTPNNHFIGLQLLLAPTIILSECILLKWGPTLVVMSYEWWKEADEKVTL